MLSVVHSVLGPIKVLPLFRSNKFEYTNNGWKNIFPKDIKYNCLNIYAKNSKIILWNYEVHFSEVSICCLSNLTSQLQEWRESYGTNFFFLDNKRKFLWICHFHNTAGFNSIKSNLSDQSLIYFTNSYKWRIRVSNCNTTRVKLNFRNYTEYQTVHLLLIILVCWISFMWCFIIQNY